jgi:hypothetical protein
MPPHFEFPMNPESSKAYVSPLLTFVVINWNYGNFIASAIRSIKQQTYNNFQCIIVDNGSKDNSIKVIIREIVGDERFSLVEYKLNVGHLGAFLKVFPLVKGDYVSIVDSDDFLLPEYAASHLQAHLYFATPVGVTTSNLIEISWNGNLAAGHRTIDRKLNVVERVPPQPRCRIEDLDEESFARLGCATVRISKQQNGWLWFPGTSNVFRRAPLEAAMKLRPNEVPVKHFSDTFLLGTCHLLEGSAFIDLPLSVYRRHDQNTENTSDIMKLGGLRAQRQQAANRVIDQRRKLCATLFLSREALTPWVSRSQLWTAADDLLRGADKNRPNHYGSLIVRRALESRLFQLAKEFGALEVWRQLRARLSPGDFVRCIVGALGHQAKVVRNRRG